MIGGSCLRRRMATRRRSRAHQFLPLLDGRKLHGAPFGAFAHARTEGFRWLRGKAAMQRDRRASRPYADWVCLPAESRSSEDRWLPI